MYVLKIAICAHGIRKVELVMRIISQDGAIDDKCCGTCKYHGFENLSDGFSCVNEQSEYFEDFTEYNDSCEEWEESGRNETI